MTARDDLRHDLFFGEQCECDLHSARIEQLLDSYRDEVLRDAADRILTEMDAGLHFNSQDWESGMVCAANVIRPEKKSDG